MNKFILKSYILSKAANAGFLHFERCFCRYMVVARARPSVRIGYTETHEVLDTMEK